MPKSKSNFGLPTFSEIDPNSTPKQACHVPHEGDPFCGNDNNRRAHALMKKAEAEAKGISVEAEPEAVGEVEDEGTNAEEPVAQPSAPSWTPRA